MATVAIKIHKHHKKADGTYNVKIQITHKREKKYIDTPHYVVDKQLTAISSCDCSSIFSKIGTPV